MKVLWRIAIRDSEGLRNFKDKFGDDLNTDEEITARFKEIHELGINLAGIHFHCGSGQ